MLQKVVIKMDIVEQEQAMNDLEIPEQSTDNVQVPQGPAHQASEVVPREYQMGEHVIAFWLEAKWHLGGVEGLKNGNPVVSYMIRADSKGKSWTYPESAEVLETSCDQILTSKVKVQYLGLVHIRCNIFANEIIHEMNTAVNNK